MKNYFLISRCLNCQDLLLESLNMYTDDNDLLKTEEVLKLIDKKQNDGVEVHDCNEIETGFIQIVGIREQEE